MSDALYNDRILALAGGLKRVDRLDDPQASVTVSSPMCGSRIKVDLVMDGDRIAAYGQEVRACALGQSSAALMSRLAVGKTAEGVRRAAAEMRAMLKEGGPPPTGDWAEYAVLEPARDHRSRHASIMLPFDAVLKAIDEIRGGRDGQGDEAAAVSANAPARTA